MGLAGEIKERRRCDVTDIASSSFRELDAVALATNVTVLMERGTSEQDLRT